MSTVFPNAFAINGVIDTGKSVLENMNLLAEAAGSWMTYDIHAGKWAVVINTTGSSVASFNDTNIIGGINLNSTSLTEVYNSVEMEFPHKDLRDEPDYVKLSIAGGDRYPNEPDNILTINSQLINNPVQAQAIASRQLKQSRIDKVISFTTDWSKIGLKAGDLIDITNTAYGFSSKVFRIISIEEADADDGTIVINITALEYDANVYSTSGLVYETRSRNNGIVAKTLNTATTAKDNTSTTTNVANSLLDPSNTLLATLLMYSLTRNGNTSAITGPIGVSPLVYSFQTDFLSAVVTNGTSDYINLGYHKYIPATGTYKIKYNINWGGGAAGSAAGVGGALKTSTIAFTVSGYAGILDINDSATGDLGVPIYEDHIIEGVIYPTYGDRIDFYFKYSTDWPTAVFKVSAELILLERA